MQDSQNSILLSKWIISVLFTLVCLTWGTTFLAIRIAVESVPPMLSSGLRFVIAFPFLFLVCKIFRIPLFFPKDKLGFFILLTLGYFCLPYFLMNYGEQYVSAGLGSLLFSTMPVFSIIFSRLLLNIKVQFKQLLGITIGAISLLLILSSSGLSFGFSQWLGVLALLTASMMHGFCYVYSKKTASNLNPFTFNTLPIGIAGLLLCVTSLIVEEPNLGAITTDSWLALIYLGVVASVAGFVVYFYLLQHMNPVVLSFVFIIFPVLALVFEAWYMHTSLSAEFMLYVMLMLFGFSLTKLPSNNDK